MAGRIQSFTFPEVKLFSGEDRAGINFFMSQEAFLTRAATISFKQAKPRVIVVSKKVECFFHGAGKQTICQMARSAKKVSSLSVRISHRNNLLN